MKEKRPDAEAVFWRFKNWRGEYWTDNTGTNARLLVFLGAEPIISEPVENPATVRRRADTLRVLIEAASRRGTAPVK